MSFLTPTASGERAVLKAFALQQIGQVRTTLHGLTTEQAHQRTTVSAFSLAMVARHIRNVAVDYGEDIAVAPACPQNADAVIGGGDDDTFSLPETATPDDLRADLDEGTAALGSAIDRADLDAIVPRPNAPWYPEDLEGWETRWVILHVITEIARHAGHADIIRESLDGKISYELNARSDGELADDEEFVAWE